MRVSCKSAVIFPVPMKVSIVIHASPKTGPFEFTHNIIEIRLIQPVWQNQAAPRVAVSNLRQLAVGQSLQAHAGESGDSSSLLMRP